MRIAQPLRLAAAGILVAAALIAVGRLPQAAADVAGPLPALIHQWLGGVAAEPDWTAQPLGSVLQQARQRGVLTVAVRAYRRPAPPGAPTPAEPDTYDAVVARYIGRTLGVKVQLVNLPAADEAPRLSGALARPAQADLIIAGTRHGMPVALDTSALAPGQAAAARYVQGRGGLVGLRAAAGLADPAGRSVCLQQGSPYAADLVRRHARLQVYASSVRAIQAFMSGDCELLAEEESLLRRLMARQEWRFYRQLPAGIEADDASAQIVLTRDDAASSRYLDQVVRHWRTSGAQQLARDQRVGEVNFEVSTLLDGLICHS